MPYKTIIRLLGVALNPANGFPTGLLVETYAEDIETTTVTTGECPDPYRMSSSLPTPQTLDEFSQLAEAAEYGDNPRNVSQHLCWQEAFNWEIKDRSFRLRLTSQDCRKTVVQGYTPSKSTGTGKLNQNRLANIRCSSRWTRRPGTARKIEQPTGNSVISDGLWSENIQVMIVAGSL